MAFKLIESAQDDGVRMRRGEILGLRWEEDIDLAAMTVRIGRARVLVDYKVIEKPPKSGRGFRTLPLDEPMAALRALREQQTAEKLAARVLRTRTAGT